MARGETIDPFDVCDGLLLEHPLTKERRLVLRTWFEGKILWVEYRTGDLLTRAPADDKWCEWMEDAVLIHAGDA